MKSSVEQVTLIFKVSSTLKGSFFKQIKFFFFFHFPTLTCQISYLKLTGKFTVCPFGLSFSSSLKVSGSLHVISIDSAAKSLLSCPTLWDPIDGSPPGSPIPGILQARILEWVAISFSNAWKWKVKSEVAQSCPTLSDPMDCSLPASSIHGIFQARVLEWGAIAFSRNLP